MGDGSAARVIGAERDRGEPSTGPRRMAHVGQGRGDPDAAGDWGDLRPGHAEATVDVQRRGHR